MIGKTLGHYQISSQLGKGGMGEVYQAKDHKLGRDVAIKVLPEEFARDADRVARFQREAKLLASLNHPNIAAIHGLEESAGTNFLVLELVEGETLADRIKRGPIPVEESLKLALQIAEALEAAHEKGVVHRDLKPANIKVTPDGKVKVLDFGLAKAFAGEQAEMNLSNSPTLSNAATQQGVILGTAAYMSPEQARGESVDKKADIWAFGCVLFEMLTGREMFEGRTVSDILASVIKSEPEWKRLPANLHPRIRLLLERCLEKELKNRYSGIGDARVDIQKVLTDPMGVLAQPITAAVPRSQIRTMLPWLAAILGIIIVGVAVWHLRKPEPRQVMRFEYELPEGQQFSTLTSHILDVSPDGKRFVYSTPKGLYLRSVNELTGKFISGTEGPGVWPFFSADGQWIGYLSQGDKKLKKISINGGAPVVLCDVASLAVAKWNTDNTIIFCPYPSSTIMRVSADGGTPETLIKAKSGVFVSPQILPDNKSVLFTDVLTGKIMVQSLKSGERKELFPGDTARYLPTGHIIYVVENNLFAVPFNPDKLEVEGGQVPVVGGVFKMLPPLYAVSDSGTLVYVPQTMSASPDSVASSGRTLVWVDRKGREEPIGAPLNEYRFPNISPDGTRAALTITSQQGDDIWVWDIIRKTLTRLTFEGKSNMPPLWTPDGKRIAFWSNDRANNGYGVYWKAADGTGQDEPLNSKLDRTFSPFSWSKDGKILVGQESPDNQTFDIAIMSMEGDHERKPLLQQEYLELQPKISPDGRWIAYASTESGKHEVYVRSFPDVNRGRWQISTSGGDSPLWSPDGRELFYMNGDTVVAVSVTTDPTFNVVGTPGVLFRGAYVRALPGPDGTPWGIHPNGKRFLMMKPPASAGAAPVAAGPHKINVVLNFLEELKQRVPKK
jgi:serine/threonine protein kinase/Tol biopolymer transport system component